MREKDQAKPRNSSIELLHILAMFAITVHHYVRSELDIIDHPETFAGLRISVNKMFVELVALPSGKIGVVAFFAISAWFLSSGDATLRSAMRRSWLLEKELLFWSLTLLALTVVVNPSAFGPSLILHSLLPTITNIWWYPTSYMIFLLLFPFIQIGLRAVGQQKHLILCIVTFALWSVIGGFLPQVTLNMPGNSAFAFIYLFILISYVRWYRHLPKQKLGWLMVGAGSLTLICWVILFELLGMKKPSFAKYALHAADAEAKFVAITVGLGIFILFANWNFFSSFVNRIAKSCLAVFLITVYPGYSIWGLVSAEPYYDGWLFIPIVLGFATGLYVVCTLLDFVRQWLFAITVDVHQSAWFDRAWDQAVILWASCKSRITDVTQRKQPWR